MRDGILIINKAPGMTSHDVVELVRRRLGTRRIGHTGTLDPMAEGVLVLVIGTATKHQQRLQAHRKQYDATMRLGTQTDTGDAWGHVIRTAPVPALSLARIEAALRSCIGPQLQTPPMFSAVKIEGRPLYHWARRGTPRTAAPRPVEIFSLALHEFTPDTIHFHVDCSTGTYIRNLAELVAERLETVGHLSRLVRLTVGEWHLDEAHPVEWLRHASVEAIWEAVRPIQELHASPHRP